MEVTSRDLWTILHGMGFGVFFMLAFSGAIAELYRLSVPGAPPIRAREQWALNFYLGAMVLLAWLTVFSGAYIVYPWYRAAPPPGTTNLAAYPPGFSVHREMRGATITADPIQASRGIGRASYLPAHMFNALTTKVSALEASPKPDPNVCRPNLVL